MLQSERKLIASNAAALADATEELATPETGPERLSRLLRIRNLKMARSSHAYVRGSTAKFYEWLPSSSGHVPEGPPVWICGDCHIGNLGPLADAKGRVAIQIRDLDQTVIGNPAHDLIRLGLSLASAARGSDLPGVTTAKMLEELVAGYEEVMANDLNGRHDKSHRPKSMQQLLQQSVRQRWRDLADERLETLKPTIPMGKRFWAITADERDCLEELIRECSISNLFGGLEDHDSKIAVELLDAAYWRKGCSSLGRLRYAVLLRVSQGREGKLRLVDIKEGVAPSAPRSPHSQMPLDNAIRVVTGARALSPNLGERMVAASLFGKAVVIRELMPQDLKIEIDRLSPAKATSLARYLAGVLGRAHGRQLEAETRRDWLAELAKRGRMKLDAPSWLWSSVVDLIAVHEAAYLEHCRLYALSGTG